MMPSDNYYMNQDGVVHHDYFVFHNVSSFSAIIRKLVYSLLCSLRHSNNLRMLPLAVNYDPPAAIKLFPATTRARSAVGSSLSLAQRSGTHCQTSSATHRYRLTVSVASLKHSCLQTRSSVHSALEIFC